MRFSSIFALVASTTLVSGWKLEIGRTHSQTFEGERGIGCTSLDKEHRYYEFHPKSEERRDDRDRECCLRLFADNRCDGRSSSSETCDQVSEETKYGFQAFSVNCKKERNFQKNIHIANVLTQSESTE
jgi:hypothetical protein